jgi:hypothetical protein
LRRSYRSRPTPEQRGQLRFALHDVVVQLHPVGRPA